MIRMHTALQEYLSMRRRLGFALRGPGSTLRRFVEFMDERGALFITTELALEWAQLPAGAQLATWSARLGMVRQFARHRKVADPRTEIPPDGLLPYRYRRQRPYIYSDTEISALLRAAGRLTSATGMRALTHQTLFGLIAATGLRVGEAVGLDDSDVDFKESLLHIRRTKFGKSRLVPIHTSACRALRKYANRRDRILKGLGRPAFFVSDRGTRVTQCAARYNFAKISRQVGLREPVPGHGHGRGPRLHDMRHRFAACTLLDWYRRGLDVERRLPFLSTYLGHVHVNETYWYLEAVPELLGLATQRLRDHGEGRRS